MTALFHGGDMRNNPGCYGVVGWPLKQSLSPLVHNAGFQALEFPAAFFAWQVPPDDLQLFMKSVRLLKIQGCAVTIPHKIAVMPYLDVICEPARIAGAVNTIFWKDGKLCGENTDVAGFLAPLKNQLPLAGPVLVLGAGGAAHAVCAGLYSLRHKDVYVTSSRNVRQHDLAKRFSFKAIAWEERYDIEPFMVVNATPLGMVGPNVGVSAYDFARHPAPERGIAYDLVYNPLETAFLASAAVNGWSCVSGLEMFYWQADAQFMHWTQDPLPLTARLALEEALGVKA